MTKCFIRICHPVDVVTLFDGGTLVVVRVHNLGGKFFTEGVVLGITAFVGELNEPADTD